MSLITILSYNTQDVSSPLLTVNKKDPVGIIFDTFIIY